MQSFPFKSANSSAPSGARLSPYFFRRRDPAELSPTTFLDEREALFVNFRTIFENWANQASGSVRFERFGFSTSDDFSLGADFFAPSDVAAEAVLFNENVSGLRFFLVAPISTFLLVFDALLGIDVAKICGDSESWAFFSDELRDRSTTTPLERRTLEAFWTSFSKRIPFVSFESNGAVSPRLAQDSSALPETFATKSESATSNWRFLGTQTFSTKILGELNDEFYYWERRAIVFSNRRFPWALVFPISTTARELKTALLSAPTLVATRETSERQQYSSTRSTATASNVLTSSIFPNPSPVPINNASNLSVVSRASTAAPSPASPEKSPETSNKETSLRRLDAVFEASENGKEDEKKTRGDIRQTLELSVEIARATTRSDVWRALKPGAVLPTDAATDTLFLGRLDGTPYFLGLPGLFRGAPAVQIKQFLDNKSSALKESKK